MFTWYARSEICYAYLEDVPSSQIENEDTIRRSRWFTRGWTLQELLAPTTLIFYSGDWSRLGTRNGSMAEIVSQITNIQQSYLQGVSSALYAAPVARKMSWLAKRTTTRVEDMAYCMLGLFEINMPLLYGEGEKAFIRLQHEIIKVSNDHTIFCWRWNPEVPKDWTSFLAYSPTRVCWRRKFRAHRGKYGRAGLRLQVVNILNDERRPLDHSASLVPHRHPWVRFTPSESV
jgi:hypothetical protein